MKKKFLLLLFCSFVIICVCAQPEYEKSDKPVEVKWSGFIMNNVFYDTREMFDALDGQAILFPLPPDPDRNGHDLNDMPNISLLSFASRLRTNISGPDAFGAETTGYLEFDFTARSNSASLRFRQAWVKFKWGNTDLLVGRTWNPFISTDVLPEVTGMSVGAPFQPFNRSDQLTLTQRIGNLSIILSALYQNDYVNNGPLGRTPAYQNNTLLPNLHAQLKYKTEHTILGVGADYKRLKPLIFTISPLTGDRFKNNATLGCPALLTYAQIKKNMFTIGAKSILGYNVSENLMTGAFAIKSVDQTTGNEEYSPYKHWFIWSHISYGRKLKAHLFTGYLKNLEALDPLIPPSANLTTTVFGLGEKISEMYRIAPSLSLTSGKVMIACELERNVAGYGEFDYSNKGKIVNVNQVRSTRVLGTMFYFF